VEGRPEARRAREKTRAAIVAVPGILKGGNFLDFAKDHRKEVLVRCRIRSYLYTSATGGHDTSP
jgi:hypothetical protein